ncbi:MAG: ABC transporter permease [Alphaproteobacteria bacterium]|jgi:microcin C transport system permease protein|nr:ABC transporter permease [Candidatus Jidaibacter sp.]
MAILYDKLSPSSKRALTKFQGNKRAFVSCIILLLIFFTTLFSDWIANDKPLVLVFKDKTYFPILKTLREEDLGLDYVSEVDFNDQYVKEEVAKHGYMIMPLINYSYSSISKDLPGPAPTAPDSKHYFGTDDHGRDIIARLLYGIRTSLLFSASLMLFSVVIGILYGAIQAYYGGLTDIIMQRFYEIWSAMPTLYIIIILSSFVNPSFSILLFVMLLFSWLTLVPVVRAEFLRARNMEYVVAAKVLGLPELRIIIKHILPNAMVATISYLPFLMNVSLTSLTVLDFLGLGLPPGSPSLGEMLSEAKENIQAYWIGSSVFVTLTMLMVLMVFIGEGLRDALDPRS